MRETLTLHIDNPVEFKEKLLSWCQKFDLVTHLNSNEQATPSPSLYYTFDALAAVGNKNSGLSIVNDFGSLHDALNKKNDWFFGHLSYDAKNQVENLTSSNFDGIGFPDLFFFQPKYVFLLHKNSLHVHYLPPHDTSENIEALIGEISRTSLIKPREVVQSPMQARIPKNEYILSIEKLKSHIQQGDIYEINFCQEFYAENKEIHPLSLYSAINNISPTPFSCFYKHGDKYLLSASPERFLKKTGNKIISQPIKGTTKRGATREEDVLLAKKLQADRKELAENIMIVDLVRNDLSRSALKGSVKVEELCGVYTFPQVHQMISTVVANVAEGVNIVDIIKKAFPMGSMTGAPKIKAMKLIEEYEKTKRGLYSGAVGFITPEKNFDFNVIIRSILYNKQKKYVSFSVGSAITIKSDPEREYQECLVKAIAMLEALHAKII